MTQRMGWVYALIDPNTPTTRYIGKTSSLHLRMAQHTQELTNSIKAEWLTMLLENNSRPIVRLLEQVPVDKLLTREEAWIAKSHSLGHRLLNGYRAKRLTPQESAQLVQRRRVILRQLRVESFTEL